METGQSLLLNMHVLAAVHELLGLDILEVPQGHDASMSSCVRPVSTSKALAATMSPMHSPSRYKDTGQLAG